MPTNPYMQPDPTQLILDALSGQGQMPTFQAPPSAGSEPPAGGYGATPSIQDILNQIGPLTTQANAPAPPEYIPVQPEQTKGKRIFGDILAGLSDALNASLRARNVPVRTDTLEQLRALRERRQAQLAYNQQQQNRYGVEQKRAEAAGKLAGLSEALRATEAQQREKQHQAELQQETGIKKQQLDIQKQFNEARIEQDKRDAELRKTIADNENAMRVQIANIEKNAGDPTQARQIAKEERDNLAAAKAAALEARDAIQSGTIDPSTGKPITIEAARKRFLDKAEIHLSGPALTAAMAWFDLKVGTQENAPPTPQTPSSFADYMSMKDMLNQTLEDVKKRQASHSGVSGSY